MDYEYRNIDTDLELKKAARRYWTEEGFTKDDMVQAIRQHGYSEWEAERAINDYYQVYVLSRTMLDRLIVFWSLVGIFMLSMHILSIFLE
jgi:hypothetical protein